jgi:phospho-N-acetylmuramoyl-pentapeptide-transferase
MTSGSCFPMSAAHVAESVLPYVVLGFVIVAGAGLPVIGALRRLSFRQHAYELAPATHAVKTGTPTMGGVLFALALLVFFVLMAGRYAHTPEKLFADVPLLWLALGCGAVGFADDYMSVVHGRNRGLSARTKFALTALVAVTFLFMVQRPFLVPAIALGSLSIGVPVWLWYGLSFVAILATTHAVNLTDGLDGLAAGSVVPPLLLLAWIAALCNGAGTSEAGFTAALTAGAALGFLMFNRHPAKVIMGDTGALLLGGILAGIAIELGQQLLLILIGGVFAAEAMSVIIQVSYFKRTKKRFFKMSPLHHHFELSGWPETKVTAYFWAASLTLSLAGAAFALVPANGGLK